MKVSVGELKEFTKAGDVRGRYRHAKGGWRLRGKKEGSAQYIRDEDEKLLRKLEEIRERWRRHFSSLLNTTSAAFDRTIMESLSRKPVTLSIRDQLVVDETKPALRSMANGKAMGPDELPAELFQLGRSDSSYERLPAFHGTIMAM